MEKKTAAQKLSDLLRVIQLVSGRAGAILRSPDFHRGLISLVLYSKGHQGWL